MSLRVVLALLLLPAMSGGEVQDPRLRLGLEVRKMDESLLVTYTAANVSGGTLWFFYNDAQQYDFALSGGGRELWRWSAQMAFAQVIWRDSLAAGASIAVEERLPWPAGHESLELRAWLSVAGPRESTGVYVALGETLVRIHLSEEREAGPSDFDGSGAVDFEDFAAFTAAFGTSRGDPGFQSGYDLDGDGRVGLSDFFLFASSFGRIGPPPGG